MIDIDAPEPDCACVTNQALHLFLLHTLDKLPVGRKKLIRSCNQSFAVNSSANPFERTLVDRMYPTI